MNRIGPNAGQASRTPRLRNRHQTRRPARAEALAGRAGSLPYLAIHWKEPNAPNRRRNRGIQWILISIVLIRARILLYRECLRNLARSGSLVSRLKSRKPRSRARFNAVAADSNRSVSE